MNWNSFTISLDCENMLLTSLQTWHPAEKPQKITPVSHGIESTPPDAHFCGEQLSPKAISIQAI